MTNTLGHEVLESQSLQGKDFYTDNLSVGVQTINKVNESITSGFIASLATPIPYVVDPTMVPQEFKETGFAAEQRKISLAAAEAAMKMESTEGRQVLDSDSVATWRDSSNLPQALEAGLTVVPMFAGAKVVGESKKAWSMFNRVDDVPPSGTMGGGSVVTNGNVSPVSSLADGAKAGDFTPVKFQGDRVYARQASNEGTGPDRWMRMNRTDSTPSTHGNSLDNPAPTHVYAIHATDSAGNTFPWKIGESAQGIRATDGASIRAEQQVRELSRKNLDLTFESEIRKWFPDKASARAYETPLIEKFRGIYGQETLPGNLTNR